MAWRFLCGIVDDQHTVPDFVRQDGRCRVVEAKDLGAYENDENVWGSLGLSEGWQPDFFLLRLGLGPVPPWVWSLPVPVVALLEDVECLWHHHRLCLPYCALAFAEPEVASRLERAGEKRVRGLEGVGRMWDFRFEIADCRFTEEQPVFKSAI